MAAEIIPAIGSRSQMIVANETSWGVVNGSPTWRNVRVIPGESMDIGLKTVRSREIRNDRMHNKTVRTTKDPGGSIPCELAPTGWNFFLYHLLGSTPVTTGPSSTIYTHILAGATSLPVGFTMEKGFTDIPEYFPFYGCRVSKGDLTFAVDRIVDGQFAIMAQDVGAASATSLNTGAPPAQETDDPYTSVQVAVYETDTSTLLGIATEMRLSIDNHLFGNAGYILGSALRQNLRPGTRETTASGKFIFKDATLYNKAIAGTPTVLRILVTSGSQFHDFLMPNFQFLPNGTMPKITDDGPLFVDANGEALPQTQLVLTDVVTTGSTTVTSVTGGFTAAMVGSNINIAGTPYQIVARASSTSITVASTTGTGTGQHATVNGSDIQVTIATTESAFIA